MRARGQWLTLVVLAILAVVSALAAALLKWPEARTWGIAAASVSAMIAVIIPLLQRRRERIAQEAIAIRTGVITAGKPAKKRLPTVAGADLRTMRVHPAVMRIPYLSRARKEAEVKKIVTAGRPVLIIGPSMVGKTRLAAEVAKRIFPRHSPLIPDSPSSLVELDKANVVDSIRHHVVWLDDIDRFFAAAGLTVGLVGRLAENNVIMATLRAREWDRFQPSDQLHPPEWEILGLFDKVVLTREHDLLDENEFLRAIPDSRDRDRIRRVGIGEYVAAAQVIADQITLGASANPLGHALVLGAVDWRRAGIVRGTPAHLLRNLAAARLAPRQRGDLADPRKYDDALAWATREINPTVSLLERGASGDFMVYDYALDILTDTVEAIPLETWRLVVANATMNECLAVGYQAAVTYGLHDIAESSWRVAADAGHPGAMYNLSVLLRDRGRQSEANVWRHRGAEAGQPDAMYALAAMAHEQGNDADLETWCRKAAEAGHIGAMYNLGVLLDKRGDQVEAELWWRKVAETFDPGPMINDLGVKLEALRPGAGQLWFNSADAARSGPIVRLTPHGDQLEIETWNRNAIATVQLDALYSLGSLLEERGDPAEAETWNRKAAEVGHAGAMYNLAVLLRKKGKHREAEIWCRKAAEAGQPEAMFTFAVLQHERGSQAEAEVWAHKGATAGHVDAMYLLSGIQHERGNQGEAEQWCRRAADAGHVQAMYSLSTFLLDRGNPVDAEVWARKAAEAGQPEAMFVVAALQHEWGNEAEAEAWCRRAAEAGYSEAMLRLAMLLEERGDQAGADDWRRKAARIQRR